MFWRTKLGLLLLIVPVVCYGAERPELSLFLDFDITPPSVFLRAMEKELAVILKPAELRLDWFKAQQKAPAGAWRTMTFSFHGDCATADSESSAPVEKFALANTPVKEGVVQSHSRIDCNQFRDFLESYEAPQPNEASRLGRAMARILAHELYHVLLQTREHSKTGIAKAVHTPATLLGRSLRFENGELDKIRALYTLTPVPTRQNTIFAAN